MSKLLKLAKFKGHKTINGLKMNFDQAVKAFSIVNDNKFEKINILIRDKMDNKFPGKDISLEDLKSKFPLAAKNKKHKSKFKIAGVEFGGSKIPIFAGPNMVESKSLILDVAKNVKKIGADFLRGGAFKPLTFPYRSKKYNETREEGVEWLGIAKKKYNIPVITEVMEERFLPMICEVADILQIDQEICKITH